MGWKKIIHDHQDLGSGDRICSVQMKPVEDISNITSLINKNGIRRLDLVNLEADDVVHSAVCLLEHSREVLNDVVKIVFACGTNNPIINNNTVDEVNFAGSSHAIINAAIRVAGDEIMQLQESIKNMNPKSPGLFKSIEMLTYMLGVFRVGKLF